MSMAAVISAVSSVSCMARRGESQSGASAPSGTIQYENNGEYMLYVTFRVKASETIDPQGLIEHVMAYRQIGK